MRGIIGILQNLLGSVGGVAGCAHSGSFPAWVDNPPKDHYVGISPCSPSQAFDEIAAFTDALKKKCQPTSGRIELRNFNPPIQELVHESCNGGFIVFGLFKSEDLNCSLIKPY